MQLSINIVIDGLPDDYKDVPEGEGESSPAYAVAMGAIEALKADPTFNDRLEASDVTVEFNPKRIFTVPADA